MGQRRILGQPLDDWARAALVPVWLGSVFVAVNAVAAYATNGALGLDALAYWTASRSATPYVSQPGVAAYLYSPAFVQVISPLAALPWPAFLTVWMILEATAFAWLLRPLGWRWGVPALLWCVPEILIGNVFGFFALALVVGIDPAGLRPAVWALPTLTKITPGVGLLWHVVRRNWQAVGVALGATIIITAVSYGVNPQAWAEWIAFLRGGAHGNRGSGGPSTLLVRLPFAVLIVVVAALRGQARLVPVGVLLALPIIDGVAVLSLLAAIPRLPARRIAGDEGSPASGLP